MEMKLERKIALEKKTNEPALGLLHAVFFVPNDSIGCFGEHGHSAEAGTNFQ